MDTVLYSGGSQLELEPLGLFKIDFMEGSMIWSEKDQNTTSCLIFLFREVVKVPNQCYVRPASDHTKTCEQGFGLTKFSLLISRDRIKCHSSSNRQV